MLIGFPCLYFVLSNFSIEEREHYARLVALTALISSGFIVIISFAMCVSINYSAEMLERYEGVTRHANLLAMLCVCTMASALYLISALRSKKRFLNFILIAMSIYILLQTGSRTSFIAAICIFVVWLIAKKDKTLHKNIRRLTKNIIVTAIIAIAVALIFVFAYRPGFFSALPEIFTVLSERFGSGIQGGVDQYSSGRIEIWQYCIDHVNLFGNDYYDSVFVTKDGFIQYYCHNTPIEFMYRCGAPAGVMYLIFEVFVAIQILRRMFSKNSIRKYELLFCMFATAYLVESMLDVQVFPFDTRALVLGFFMTLHPLFEKNHVDEKQ
jgi:O-antigen ligase